MGDLKRIYSIEKRLADLHERRNHARHMIEVYESEMDQLRAELEVHQHA